MLHYYHSADPASAAAPRIVDLAIAVEVLGHGVVPPMRPDPAAFRPVERALDSFLDTLAAAYISPADEPLRPIRLDELRRRGTPTVDDEEYAGATGRTRHRRRLLAGLLVEDGWDVPPAC